MRCGRRPRQNTKEKLTQDNQSRTSSATSVQWASCSMSQMAHAAEVAGLVARPLPLGEMARVVAQLGCDRGLHQHVPLRVQSVPVGGWINVFVDTAM